MDRTVEGGLADAASASAILAFYEMHFPGYGINGNRDFGSRRGSFKFRGKLRKILVGKRTINPVSIDPNGQQGKEKKRGVARTLFSSAADHPNQAGKKRQHGKKPLTIGDARSL